MKTLPVVWAAPTAAPATTAAITHSIVVSARPNPMATNAITGKSPRKTSRCLPVRSVASPDHRGAQPTDE